MKRLLYAAAALIMLFAAGCAGNAGDTKQGSAKENGSVVDVGGTEATAVPAKIPESSIVGNTVRIVDGRLDGTNYYWEFFMSKVSLGMSGKLDISAEYGGAAEVYKLSFVNNGFTLAYGDAKLSYAELVTFEEKAPEGSGAAKLALGILTNEASLTAEGFFGGEIPADVRVGYKTEKGMVIYAVFSR